MRHPEAEVRPGWCRTGNPHFPVAAPVEGRWWVLRMNSFPDHPMWTLFVDGEVRFDLDDLPPAWGGPADRSAPPMDANTAQEVLAPLRDLVAYGSEVDQPCDDPFCCGRRT